MPPFTTKVTNLIFSIIFECCKHILCGRLLSCNDVFSANQMGMLEMHVSRASKPLEVPPGIAKKIMTKTEGQSGISSSNSLCQLL